MIDIDRSVLRRRVGALAILGCVLGLAALLLSGPVSGYNETQSEIEREIGTIRSLQARLAAHQRLNGAIIRSPSREQALEIVSASIRNAAPDGAFRIETLQGLPQRDGMAGLLEVAVTATATPSGVRNFVEALEAGTPRLGASAFSIVPAGLPATNDDRSPLVLSARFTLAAAFAKGETK
ncbi:hypothetical protein [Rhizobium sp. NFR03]|uniref:hypothetical protein n=1 Tax=Rhizobium sp. NFR03 TaxID=1566263 RepID=UPI0008BB4531|nr:hypothetical protein [Rhizobium sp. NFR03]SES28437.1 hypothetical protein SAMN03159406_03246 [Rhizobium sp. NFR03]